MYNDSISRHGRNEAVYQQKSRNEEIYRVGVLDIEKSQLPGIMATTWQTDTCIGNWFYAVQQKYKQPGHIIEMLVDIIAKNGVMLLNILQRPDGSIDEEARVLIDGFREDRTEWTPSEWRFTRQGNTLYAFLMKVPENRVAVLKSLTQEEKVKSVRLLGAGDMEYSQNYGVLTVKLPETLPTGYVNCLAIEL